jgi:hypothetical protein
MRTIYNAAKGIAISGAFAAVAIMTSAPAFAGQAVTVTQSNGSKACIMLSGVIANAPEFVAAVLGAVLDRLGC